MRKNKMKIFNIKKKKKRNSDTNLFLEYLYIVYLCHISQRLSLFVY